MQNQVGDIIEQLSGPQLPCVAVSRGLTPLASAKAGGLAQTPRHHFTQSPAGKPALLICGGSIPRQPQEPGKSAAPDGVFYPRSSARLRCLLARRHELSYG